MSAELEISAAHMRSAERWALACWRALSPSQRNALALMVSGRKARGGPSGLYSMGLSRWGAATGVGALVVCMGGELANGSRARSGNALFCVGQIRVFLGQAAATMVPRLLRVATCLYETGTTRSRELEWLERERVIWFGSDDPDRWSPQLTAMGRALVEVSR